MTLQTNKVQKAETILERSVCLTLSCHYLGNNRQVSVDALVEAAGGKKADAESQIDAKQYHVTKRLLPTAVLNPVMRVFSVAKAKLRAKAIAASEVFGDRSYLIPLALVEAVDADLVACEADIRAEAAKLSARYRTEVEAQRVALGPTFDEADYLTPSAVAESFGIDWSYVSFGAPERLEHVSHALAERANQKHQARLSRAFDECVVGLRAAALHIMVDLERRLTPDKDGNRKGLHFAALRDLQEFQSLLPQRNIAGDDGLVRAMARVTALTQGMDVETLKDDDAARAALLAATVKAKETLGKLVETAGRRAISFKGLSDVA